MDKVRVRKFSAFNAFLAIAKYSFIASMRNPSTVFFAFLFPFIFIGVFGLISGGNVSYDIAVRDQASQDNPVYQALDKIDVLNLITDKSETEINEDLNKGRLPAAITIVTENKEISPGVIIPTYNVNLEVSTAAGQDATTVRLILENVANSFNYSGQNANSRILNLNSVEVSGRKFTQIDFILPGQLGFALLTSAVFGMAFSFITLRQTLVIKRMFATPTPRWAIMGGLAASKLIMAVLQAAVIILFGRLLFNFTLVNGVSTFLSMMILSILGLLVFLSFGLLVASVSKNEDAASPIANLINMPQLFLSGAFFPIELFPSFLQPIAKLLPLTFLNDAFRQVAFEGASLPDVWTQIVGLLIWGIVMYVVVVRIFKWES